MSDALATAVLTVDFFPNLVNKHESDELCNILTLISVVCCALSFLWAQNTIDHHFLCCKAKTRLFVQRHTKCVRRDPRSFPSNCFHSFQRWVKTQWAVARFTWSTFHIVQQKKSIQSSGHYGSGVSNVRTSCSTANAEEKCGSTTFWFWDPATAHLSPRGSPATRSVREPNQRFCISHSRLFVPMKSACLLCQQKLFPRIQMQLLQDDVKAKCFSTTEVESRRELFWQETTIAAFIEAFLQMIRQGPHGSVHASGDSCSRSCYLHTNSYQLKLLASCWWNQQIRRLFC